jgi:uncharacterized membrane protein
MYPALQWLIIASLCALLFFAWSYWRFTKGKLHGDIFFWAIFCPTLIFFGVLAGAGKYPNTSDDIMQFVDEFFRWAIRTVGLRFTQVLVALVISALGLGAHYFKTKNQKWYGIVEVIFGTVTAFLVAGTLAPGKLDLSKWATLAGTSYVIARGWGNYGEGKRKVNGPSVA